MAALPDPGGAFSGKLNITATTTCPSVRELEEALSALGWSGAPSEVSVHDLGAEHLEVALTQAGALRFRRALARGRGGCAQVALTVALLVEAWLTLPDPSFAAGFLGVPPGGAPPEPPTSAQIQTAEPPMLRGPTAATHAPFLQARLLGGFVPTLPIAASGDLALQVNPWRQLPVGMGLHAGLLTDAMSTNAPLLAHGIVDAQVIVRRQRFGGFAAVNLGRWSGASISALAMLDDLHGTAASPGYPSGVSTSTDIALLGTTVLITVPVARALQKPLVGPLYDRFFLVGQAGLSVALAASSYVVNVDGSQLTLQSSPRFFADLCLGVGMRLL